MSKNPGSQPGGGAGRSARGPGARASRGGTVRPEPLKYGPADEKPLHEIDSAIADLKEQWESIQDAIADTYGPKSWFHADDPKVDRYLRVRLILATELCWLETHRMSRRVASLSPPSSGA